MIVYKISAKNRNEAKHTRSHIVMNNRVWRKEG